MEQTNVSIIFEPTSWITRVTKPTDGRHVKQEEEAFVFTVGRLASFFTTPCDCCLESCKYVERDYWPPSPCVYVYKNLMLVFCSKQISDNLCAPKREKERKKPFRWTRQKNHGLTSSQSYFFSKPHPLSHDPFFLLSHNRSSISYWAWLALSVSFSLSLFLCICIVSLYSEQWIERQWTSLKFAHLFHNNTVFYIRKKARDPLLPWIDASRSPPFFSLSFPVQHFFSLMQSTLPAISFHSQHTRSPAF